MEQDNSEYISSQNWAKSFLELQEWSISPELSDLSMKTKLPLNSVEERLTVELCKDLYVPSFL